MEPLQLSFYKGLKGTQGAIQFNYQRPHFYIKSNPKLKNFQGKFIPDHWNQEGTYMKEDLSSREGALFMEVCSAIGNNEYDWTRKIKMALSIVDLGKLLTVLEGVKPDVKILHDPGAKSATQGEITKTFNVSCPKGLATGVFITVTQSTKNEEIITHQLGLSGEDVKVLAVCIRGVIPSALAWI